MKRAEIFRRTREIEADLQHRHPDWQKRMAAWEDSVAGQPAEWTVVQPDSRRHLHRRPEVPADEGRLDAGAGLCADEAHGQGHREDGRCTTITAFRLELLTDPDLPLRRTGPLDQRAPAR